MSKRSSSLSLVTRDTADEHVACRGRVFADQVGQQRACATPIGGPAASLSLRVDRLADLFAGLGLPTRQLVPVDRGVPAP